MHWAWLIIILGLLGIHAVISFLAILQIKRFWHLNRRSRVMTWLYILSVVILDILILATFFEL